MNWEGKRKFERNLNPKQLEAVLCTEGPVLVLAGVGSGKTRVLTYRIAYLIEKGIAKPWNILAMTFTNKAAGEMKNRIRSMIGHGDTDLSVSTFHSVCARILRGHAHELGYGNNFVIYDDKDQISMIETCLKELDIDTKVLSPKYAQFRMRRVKENLLSIDDFVEEDNGDHLEESIRDLLGIYQGKMKASNAMDFDDLIFLTAELFDRNPEVLSYYQHRWRYVLIDEFQDTNFAQYEMVKRLCQGHRNLCVVGDDDQSIYSWRGANPVNILYFENDFPETRVILLEQNYRSTKKILEASGEVIQNNYGRKNKQLWTQNPSGDPVIHYCATDERDEVRFVLDEIERGIQEEGWQFSEVAIFYRTHAQSRVFEEELMARRLPYAIFGGVGFYERKEIKDIIAYLRAIANDKDSISWKRIINTPKRGIGKTTVERIEKISVQKEVSFEEALRAWLEAQKGVKGIQKRVHEFLKQMERFRLLKEEKSISELTHLILQDTGYIDLLKAEKTEDSRQRLQNLEEFFHLVDEYLSNANGGGLSEFLQGICLVSDIDRLDETENRLSLMTLHSAKGLEFPVVIIVGMEEGLFPHYQSTEDEERLEEERRLCYVGMTRAQRMLYLTRAQRRWRFGIDHTNRASRFIDEISEGVIKEVVMTCEDLADERSSLFYPGQWVRHPNLGVGTIRFLWGAGPEEKAVIHFPGVGEITLALQTTPLKKIT
jgi:DNA helicase-2/ATP-dependent DNA helicase PcrA